MTALAILQGPTACRAAERYVFQVLDQEQGLSNGTVTRLAHDRQGALWVGTENGLYRYDGHRFLRFTTSEGLPGNKVTAIHESPDGTLWVGTLDGLAWKEGAGFRKATNDGLKGYINLQGIASDRTSTYAMRAGSGYVTTSLGTVTAETSLSPQPATRTCRITSLA